MKIALKNPTLKADYMLSQKVNKMTIEEASRFWSKNNYSEEKMAICMPLGYVDSLFEIVEEFEGKLEGHPTLDLTYDTVQNLPVFLAQQYFAYVGSGSYSENEALEILKKTFASYLMLLCANEHGCAIEAQRLEDFDWIMRNLQPGASHEYSWMGMTIKTGTKGKYDLLQEAGQVAKLTANGALRIRISRVAEIYKRMCGVDLREWGMDDLEGCI